MSDIALSVRNLTKEYRILHNAERHNRVTDAVASSVKGIFRKSEVETFKALDDVSFDVKKGEVLGIIGRNGAGKSTLLKVLSRITEPTSGEIHLYGRVGSLLEVGTGFHPELTGRENIYLNGAILGMKKREIDRQFDAIVDFAEVEKFLDTPVKRYSSGMYVRLAFAVAAHLNPEILIVDEVLAVGDAQFQKKCLGKMQDVSRQEGRTVLFVSHNMGAVRDICGTTLLLRDGQLAFYGLAMEGINQYAEKASTNKIESANGPLRSISAYQDGHAIKVEASYSTDIPIEVPCLGIVISDTLGIPVFGINPRLVDLTPHVTPTQNGRIVLQISQPKLLDGLYRLSAWFGNQYEDFVSLPDCISFSVSGMAGPRQLDRSIVGSVFPETSWYYSDSFDIEASLLPWERVAL